MGGGASGTAAGGGGAGDAGAGAAGGGVAGADGIAAGAAVAGGAALSGGSGSAAHTELGANNVLTSVRENATTLGRANATTLGRANVEAMAGVLFTRCYSVFRRGTKRETMNGSTPGGSFNRFGQGISSDPKVSYLFGARL